MRWQAVSVDPLDLTISGVLARELPPGDFDRIVESFATDVLRLTEEMAQALAAGDRMGVHCAAHGLAGAAASVGAVVLEQAARRGLGQAPCSPDLIPRVRATGGEALLALRSLLSRPDAA